MRKFTSPHNDLINNGSPYNSESYMTHSFRYIITHTALDKRGSQVFF